MDEDQTEFGSERPELSTIKQMRRDHPSGWLELSKDPARALLIDAVLDSPPEHEFSPGEISPRAGITPQSVRNHIDILVERGLIDKIDESQYKVNDSSRVMSELEQLNSAVTAIRSNMASKNFGSIDPDEKMDNATPDSDNLDAFSPSPSGNPGAMNAD